MNGFYIKVLEISGLNVAPASVEFERGANIITGSSDTGKSYILTAINYILGRSKLPKKVDEGLGYSEIFIEIRSFKDDTPYTLHRTIEEKKISMKQCELKYYLTSSAQKVEYKTTGSISDEFNISNFLLSFMDYNGKRLLKNKRNNNTQSLGFSSLNKMTFISEERIITEDTPFYFSGGNSNNVVDQSLLSFILTGKDYSDSIQTEDNVKRQTKIGGKLEYISSLLSKYSVDRNNLNKQIDEQIPSEDIKITIDSLNKQLENQINNAKYISETKDSIIKDLDIARTERRYNDELINRFQILNMQYLSDKKRLDFILETESLSTQIGDVICPICNSSLENDHITHLKEMEGFKQAANEEMNKITVKLNELNETLLALNKKNETVDNKIAEYNKQIEELKNDLAKKFLSEINSIKKDLAYFIKINEINKQIEFIDKEVNQLYAEKDALTKSLKDKKEDPKESILSYSLLSEYCQFIETRLNNWNYETNARVNFNSDYKIFDIDISGKTRGSYGKGKRAISYTACILGLLDYCKAKKKKFSNLIVLDSPLTAFKDKGVTNISSSDEKEKMEISKNVEKAFFKDLSKTPKDCQIIMFDNKEPDASEKNGIHTIVFTKDKNVGRAGFFPV